MRRCDAAAARRAAPPALPPPPPHPQVTWAIYSQHDVADLAALVAWGPARPALGRGVLRRSRRAPRPLSIAQCLARMARVGGGEPSGGGCRKAATALGRGGKRLHCVRRGVKSL